MIHEKIFIIFEERFSDIASQSCMWFPNGKDSVRVRMKNKQEFIFTYHGEKDWSLETINRYLTRLKGEK